MDIYNNNIDPDSDFGYLRIDRFNEERTQKLTKLYE
ncbi:MAG: GTP cyclohydrolase I FolE, partial [Bacteroidetes bacterium]